MLYSATVRGRPKTMTHYRRFVSIFVLICGAYGVVMAQLPSLPPWGGGTPNDIVDKYQKSYLVPILFT